MNILALDCVSTCWTLAVKSGTKYVSVTFDLGMKQGEKMLPSLIYLLGEIELKPAEIDYAAVTAGPGSFTSLRIGFAMLKALSLSHNISVYAVPTLEVYAYPFLRFHGAVLSVIDAKRAHFFLHIYRNGKCVASGDYAIEKIAHLFDAEERILVCGFDAPFFLQMFANDAHNALFDMTLPPLPPPVESLFLLAEKKYAVGAAPLSLGAGPEYMRLSEAEEKQKE